MCLFFFFVSNLSSGNVFHLCVNGNLFSYERLCTKTHFEKEAQDNSEMAYSRVIHNLLYGCHLLFYTCTPIKYMLMNENTYVLQHNLAVWRGQHLNSSCYMWQKRSYQKLFHILKGKNQVMLI